MKFLFEVPAHGNRWDALGMGDGLVASVELKEHLGSVVSDWWVSGLNKEGELLALGRFSFGLGRVSVNEATQALGDFYKSLIAPIVPDLRGLGGLSVAPNPASKQSLKALCLTHLDLHEQLGNVGEHLGLRANAARQFQLTKSFGYSAAQALIAERMDLPLRTFARRVDLARADGLLRVEKDYAKQVRRNAQEG
jgi:hypothetical protein